MPESIIVLVASSAVPASAPALAFEPPSAPDGAGEASDPALAPFAVVSLVHPANAATARAIAGAARCRKVGADDRGRSIAPGGERGLASVAIISISLGGVQLGRVRASG
jgi:hypothetical protein